MRRLGSTFLILVGVVLLVVFVRDDGLDTRRRAVCVLIAVMGGFLSVVGALDIRLGWRPWLRWLAVGVVGGALAAIVAIAFALRGQTPADFVPDDGQLGLMHQRFAEHGAVLVRLAVAVAYLLVALLLTPTGTPKTAADT